MSSTPHPSPAPVTNLDAARAARAAEAAHREALRPFLVHITLASFAVLPPGAGPDDTPRSEVFDAADLIDDPGRLGEIARAMMARVEAAQDRSAGHA